MRVIDGRITALKFCSGSMVGGLRRRITRHLKGIYNCSSCSFFLVGDNTRTGRGTLGLTSFCGNHAHIVSFSGTFRKHASLTIRMAGGPGVVTPVGGYKRIACLPLGSVRTVGTRLSGKSIYTIVVRNVRNMNNVRLPASRFVRTLHRPYARRGAILVLSRVRDNCKHDNGFFTRRCGNVGTSVVAITGNVNGNFPVTNMLVDPVFAPMCKRLKAAFNKGRLTYDTTLTILSIVRRRGLVRGTTRINGFLVARLGGFPRVGSIHKHKLVVKLRFRRPVGRLHLELLGRRRMFANMDNAGMLHLLPPLYLNVSRTGRFLRHFGGMLWCLARVVDRRGGQPGDEVPFSLNHFL